MMNFILNENNDRLNSAETLDSQEKRFKLETDAEAE
jgi:hypothetical protein